jgi:tetratricopeptide (TPR) repeat protein
MLEGIALILLAGACTAQTTGKKVKDQVRSQIIVSQFPDDSNDIPQKFYKSGYHLILNEKWAQARERLMHVSTSFPRSKYNEAAQYWIAFTLKEDGQPGTAREAYRVFIDRYPHSNYYDDAIADLDELLHVPPQPPEVIVPIIRMDGSGKVTPDSLRIAYRHKNTGFSYYINVAPRVQSLENLFRMEIRMGGRRPPVSLKEVMPPEMQKQFDVILSATSDLNSELFQHLEGVVLDPTKPNELREAAVVSLSISDTFDALPVFEDLVKNDTNKGLQYFAFENLRQYKKDRNKAVAAMIRLFKELPPEKSDEREMIFYSIADVGNDKAIDFLIDIAESKIDSEFTDQAIYYLGSMGSEKARNALRKVYKIK